MKKKKWKKLYGASVSFTCPYCLKNFPLSEATRDHLVPSSRGGKTEPDNLVLSCSHCNAEKGALTPEEYVIWKQLNELRIHGKQKG